MGNAVLPTLTFSCSSTSTEVTATVTVAPNGKKTGNWDFPTFDNTNPNAPQQVNIFALPVKTSTFVARTGEKLLTYITHSGPDTNGQLIVENPSGAPYTVTCSTAHPTHTPAHHQFTAGGGSWLGIIALLTMIRRRWA